MMSFFSKIWFPTALVSVVTFQMAGSHRPVETTDFPAAVCAAAPEDWADTVKYPRAGYKKLWTPEEKSSTIHIATMINSGLRNSSPKKLNNISHKRIIDDVRYRCIVQ